MGNIGVSFKRFIGNKNTITIIGVLAGIAILYFGYNWRVKLAVDPIEVPFASRRIPGNTQITRDMVGVMRINRSVTREAHDIIQSSGQVIGMYVRYDTTIAEGSLFYSDMLEREERLADAMIRDIPEGYTVYRLPVDINSTYGNSIMPGNYIDLYFSAVDDNNIVMFGRFIQSIQVLAVRDNKGLDVFTSASTGAPALLYFAVPDWLFELLTMADQIRTNRISITPVPRNKDYSENPEPTDLTSVEIESFIRARAVSMQQDPGLDFDRNQQVPEESNEE